MLDITVTPFGTRRMRSSRVSVILIPVVFWLAAFFYVMVGVSLLHSSSIGLNPTVLNLNANEVKDKFDVKTIPLALSTTRGLVLDEHKRFEHLDGKANTYLGMIGIAITVLTSIAASNRKKGKTTPAPEDGSVKISCLSKLLYVMAFLAFMFSFFLALLSTQIPKDRQASFLGFEVAMRSGLDAEVVFGPKYNKQPIEQYRRTLIAEYIEVYRETYKANAVKADYLSRSQSAAFMAGIALLGMVIISVMSGMGVAASESNDKKTL